jgi:L-ascorbate metabolism protein UlaG (beta-lactamase superfamily)
LIKISLILIASTILLIFLFLRLNPQFGGKSGGSSLIRIQNSPNYSKGKFHNTVPTSMAIGPRDFFAMIKDQFSAEENRQPESIIDNLPLNLTDRADDQIAWLGHSSIFVQVDGIRMLVDPFISKRASMLSFIGPKTFQIKHEYSIAELGQIDLVLITHDHYDHLDYAAIKVLKELNPAFFVPLGIGAHLEKWGIPAENITELDWWEDQQIGNGPLLTAVPGRHFSGRGIFDRNRTLWAAWVVKGSKSNILLGGDSGYFNGFKEIGSRLGPFDVCLLECGAYSKYWSSIHMFPKETLQAAIDLQAEVLLPIHWGKISLSLHGWQQPINELLQAASLTEMNIAIPQIGETWFLDEEIPYNTWWISKD